MITAENLAKTYGRPKMADDGISNDFDSAKVLAIALTRGENALVFGGYTAIALIAGAILLHRRDVN